MNKKLAISLNIIAGIVVIFSLTQCKDIKSGNQSLLSITNNAAKINNESTDKNTKADSQNKSLYTTNFHQPANLTDRSDIFVKHSGHVLSYNKNNNTPNWVAWMLTANMLKGNLERSTKFWADPNLPSSCRVDYYEYKESVYDRGHMCPAGDNKWNQDAMHDCFYMSNMCPQDRTLNSHSWENLESLCRTWAINEGTIFICCGPYYEKGKRHYEIGIHHKILVPEGFFKVVLSLRKGHEKAIGFFYNNNSKSQSPENAARSVDEIERKTGIDFFADLNDKLESKVESMTNLGDWE